MDPIVHPSPGMASTPGTARPRNRPAVLDPAGRTGSTTSTAPAAHAQVTAPPGVTGLLDAPIRRQPDEIHALLIGLDPVTATVALLLADAGVCLLNVSDPSPVTERDVQLGPYPRTLVGVPREYALRRMLRARWTRCVPVSAPELFCSSAIPTAVVLRGAHMTGPSREDLVLAATAEPVDTRLPSITVVTDDSYSLTWPISPWFRRPCRDCLVAAVIRTRQQATNDPSGVPAVSAGPASWLTAVTRMTTGCEIAVSLLTWCLGSAPTGFGTDHDVAPGTGPWPDGNPGQVILRRGPQRTEWAVSSDCLCSLDV